MACKYCHKPKLKFVQGKCYVRTAGMYDGDIHICARTTAHDFRLISLVDGNRWSDYSIDHELIQAGWKEVPNALYKQRP